MKSIKQIILESLRHFRELLLEDIPIQNDTKHALSCAGAYDLQNTIVHSITRSGTQFTAKNSAGATLFTFDYQDNNTTYSAGTGISTNGTQFYLPNVATAGTYGPNGDVTGNNGNTIAVPQITINAQGKVTSIVNRTYKSVNTDTNTTTGTSYAAGSCPNNTTFATNGSVANVYNAIKGVAFQKTSKGGYAKIDANARAWYDVTNQKPSDTNYNWYLMNAVVLTNASTTANFAVIEHTSQSGIYVYSRGTGILNPYISAYWMGVHK